MEGNEEGLGTPSVSYVTTPPRTVCPMTTGGTGVSVLPPTILRRSDSNLRERNLLVTSEESNLHRPHTKHLCVKERV